MNMSALPKIEWFSIITLLQCIWNASLNQTMELDYTFAFRIAAIIKRKTWNRILNLLKSFKVYCKILRNDVFKKLFRMTFVRITVQTCTGLSHWIYTSSFFIDFLKIKWSKYLQIKTRNIVYTLNWFWIKPVYCTAIGTKVSRNNFLSSNVYVFRDTCICVLFWHICQRPNLIQRRKVIVTSVITFDKFIILISSIISKCWIWYIRAMQQYAFDHVQDEHLVE